MAPVPESANDGDRWAAVEEATELLKEERFREALVALRDVLRADPRNAYAYNFLGVALFEIGDQEAARDAYLACLKLAPAYLGARVALSHVLRGLGDSRGALREGLTALSQSPEDPDALYAVGLAYRSRGDLAAARRALAACLQAGPDFREGIEARALLAEMTPDEDLPDDDSTDEELADDEDAEDAEDEPDGDE